MSSQPMHKCSSVNSIHSMVGMGHLPPGHGYIPSREKPDKPYGPSFVTVMNRMWRGPGRKYINYAIACLCIAILFFVGGAVYFGHRNVGRMRVLNTEVLGALLVVVGLLFTAAFFQLLYKANVESDKWRAYVKFRPEGLYTVAAYNQAYLPDDDAEVLYSGTYGPMAIKEIPRTSRPVKSRGRSAMLRSGAQTPARSGMQTPARSGLQTPTSYRDRGYDEVDIYPKGQSSRAPNQGQPGPPLAPEPFYGEEKRPVRAQGPYYPGDVGPIRAQGANYYEDYPVSLSQPTYKSEKEREALGGQSSSNSGELLQSNSGGAIGYPFPTNSADEMTSGIRPAQVSTPQPSFYRQQLQQPDQTQQQQQQQQQQQHQQPEVSLPPVRRVPVLPPVQRKPVSSSKKSQSQAFIG